MGVVKNLEGLKFGRLLVMSYSGLAKNRRNAMWMCKCECGNYKAVRSGDLQNGNTTSCGCFKIEAIKNTNTTHGQNRRSGTTPEYGAWALLKDRCYNENGNNYSDYGARGISVCERWVNSFENFFADMGERPTNKHSIDRYPNNNGNYEPENCRWATKKQQANNVRDNRKVAYKNVVQNLSEWRDELGFKYGTVLGRLNRGWSVEKAFETVTDERYKNKKV